MLSIMYALCRTITQFKVMIFPTCAALYRYSLISPQFNSVTMWNQLFNIPFEGAIFDCDTKVTQKSAILTHSGSKSILRKTIPTRWCYHQHASLSGWCPQGEQCLVSSKWTALYQGQKITFWYHQIFPPTFASWTWLLAPDYNMTITPNRIL